MTEPDARPDPLPHRGGAPSTRLTAAARRRAIVTGVGLGPFASAGLGAAWIGARQVFSGGGTIAWLLLGIGVLSIVIAVAAGLRGLGGPAGHPRARTVTLASVALVGLPLTPLAPGIAVAVILGTSVQDGSVTTPATWVVLLATWTVLALPGLVFGPLATWWIAHRMRHLPHGLAHDDATLARYDATVRED